jgi:hypothetical protein
MPDPNDLPEAPDLDVNLSDLQIETLAGDIRDAMLMRVRDMKRPWSLLTQAEQSDLANGLDLAANEMVRAAVRLLTSWEWPRAVVHLDNIKIVGGDKAKIEAKIVAPNISDYRDVLGQAVGSTVMVLMVDSATFTGERAPVGTDPDEPGLPGVSEAA